MTELQAAIEAAFKAGDLLRRKFSHVRTVRSKGVRDLVTDADLAAQETILQQLALAFPQHRVLAEEGLHAIDLAQTERTWVIDPLDGTSNYARQLPNFAVVIGLVQGNTIELGVVYDPLRRELFYAERGQGAFVQIGRGPAKRLAVSRVAHVSGAIVGVSWPREAELRERSHIFSARVGTACHTLRAFGSAALTLVYIAAGRLDASYHLELQPWDVAAPALILAEAGGQITTAEGAAWQLGQPRVVASNGLIHAELIQVLTG